MLCIFKSFIESYNSFQLQHKSILVDHTQGLFNAVNDNKQVRGQKSSRPHSLELITFLWPLWPNQKDNIAKLSHSTEYINSTNREYVVS